MKNLENIEELKEKKKKASLTFLLKTITVNT